MEAPVVKSKTQKWSGFFKKTKQSPSETQTITGLAHKWLSLPWRSQPIKAAEWFDRSCEAEVVKVRANGIDPTKCCAENSGPQSKEWRGPRGGGRAEFPVGLCHRRPWRPEVLEAASHWEDELMKMPSDRRLLMRTRRQSEKKRFEWDFRNVPSAHWGPVVYGGPLQKVTSSSSCPHLIHTLKHQDLLHECTWEAEVLQRLNRSIYPVTLCEQRVGSRFQHSCCQCLEELSLLFRN